MTGETSLGADALGAATSIQALSAAQALFFDPSQTIISQYANSPVIQALVSAMAAWLDPQARFDLFYELIWNIDTAQGYGLDVWGRIVGVERVLQVPTGGFLGFSQDTQAETFGSGVFYSGNVLTSNFRLSDTAYRRLILAKALSNITDGSIPAINQILLNLFPDYGNSYVRDNGNMSMTFVIGAVPTAVDLSVILNSGVLPKPAGVSVSVEHA